MLEHGGNLRDAALRFGRDDWLDLSTGINPHWYPAPALPDNSWHRLPEADPELAAAAAAYYGAPLMLPVAGTQAAIQALPRLRKPSRVTVSAPSYAEHAHHWSDHGHTLTQTPYAELDAAVAHSDVMVVINPNNPTGAVVPAAQLLQWADQLAARGGWLLVDEAFGDTDQQNSIAAHGGRPGLIVLRSIGKFFGLADLLGPWTISGPAQHIALAALRDEAWQADTLRRLQASAARLQALLAAHGIQSSGTPLFQWWPEPRAEEFWRHMAERGIWIRLFKHAARGVRLGLPPDEAGWLRLQTALTEWTTK